MLNRGDELVNLPLGCIQPYGLFIAESMASDLGLVGEYPVRCACTTRRRRRSQVYVHPLVCVAAGFSPVPEQKSEPNCSFILPHRDPLRYPVGSFASMLWFIFDEENLVSHMPEWDWSLLSTWRKVQAASGPSADFIHADTFDRRLQIKLMYGSKVGKECKPDSLRRTYTTIFDKISSAVRSCIWRSRQTLRTKGELLYMLLCSSRLTKMWQGELRRHRQSRPLVWQHSPGSVLLEDTCHSKWLLSPLGSLY